MSLYSNNKHPETNILNTGYKDINAVKRTIKLISKRSIIYQKSVINTMYNRAKYHQHKTEDMTNAMKYMKSWLTENKNKSYKYEYLDLNIIKKFEKIADKYNISRVARGLDKPVKSEHGFLTMYKKYGKSKLPFIPLFKNKPEKGDYDIFREKYINARLGQMKTMKIKLYKENGEPTNHHLTLIMNGYSPDKDIHKYKF
jgi:hypothetical protein